MLIVVTLLATAAPAARAAVTHYQADNTTIFKNPERGFTEELSRRVSVNNPNVVKGQLSDNWGKAYQMTLAVVLYNFGPQVFAKDT